MPPDRTLRLLVVEPHPAVRHALAANLESEPGFAVVGEAAGGEQALVEIERLRPDVVLLDLALLEPGCSSVIDAVRERSPASRIVVLSALEDEQTIGAALAAGAHARASKDAFREELVAAVRGACAERGGPASRLSGREIEILRLVARGLSNREISATLTIAEGTVKSHLRRIFVKMGVDDRTRAAIAALKQGAIEL